MKKSRLNQRGTAAVEFAILLPILLLIVFGTIEYSWYLTSQFVLNNAVAQGARAGVKAKEWEDEDPLEIAKTAVQNSFWLIGEDQKAAFAQKIISEIKEDDAQPRTLEVLVRGFVYSPVTGYIPRDWIPKFLGAKAVMAFP